MGFWGGPEGSSQEPPFHVQVLPRGTHKSTGWALSKQGAVSSSIGRGRAEVWGRLERGHVQREPGCGGLVMCVRQPRAVPLKAGGGGWH